MANLSVISDVVEIIENNTKKPENYLSLQTDVANKFQKSTKLLYDLTKNETNRQNAALPELVVEDFDEEQIWQQLEIQNEAELTHFLTGVSRLLSGKKDLNLPISLTQPGEETNEEEPEKEDDEDEGEDEEMHEAINAEIEREQDSDSDMDVDIDKDGNLRKVNTEKRRTNKKPSIVDDKFFKLEELDEYLTKEDKKESKTKIEESEESEEDDDSVDLFKKESEDDEEDDEEGKMVKYADFFDSPDDDGRTRVQEMHEDDDFGEEENEDDENHDRKRKFDDDGSQEKRVKFNLTNDSDTDSEENNKFGDEDAKSTLENRQERLQQRIKELESQAISEKPWQLKGEVTAGNRPKDSLLEEFVEFDITSRPAPVVTEQTTMTLEDLIKRRIKDKAWDDVERKIKPVETPLEYKKKLVMDQEKSQKSLAQIYEESYLKQKEALKPDADEKEEEEPKEHLEVRKLMTALFSKLDALSNFHYTPKPAQPELKIISNVPAINMEEVAPVATSDATLLAPEEVKKKSRGDAIGKSERTKTDMKRDRRKKKLMQREKQKNSEKKEKTIGELVENRRKKAIKGKKFDADLKKLTKDRNISTIDESSHRAPKSSTAFFTQLQDEVSSHIKAKTKKPMKKKDKMAHSAVKLKL